ncbi:MAG: hypothetical protein ACW98X_21500 [Promethearchaeota archaeon]|jgi:hypothetical protein
MKFIDQLNYDLEKLANDYPMFPFNRPFQFDTLDRLPNIALNPHTPDFLRNLALILEKYV